MTAAPKTKTATSRAPRPKKADAALIEPATAIGAESAATAEAEATPIKPRARKPATAKADAKDQTAAKPKSPAKAKAPAKVKAPAKAPVKASPEQAAALRDMIVAQLDKDKAQDIVVIDLAGKSSLADCMVVASGTSARQVSAMADHLMEKLQAQGIAPRAEGMTRADWVLIDAYDVIVHLFRPEVREFYALEKMWQAAVAEDGTVAPALVTDTP